MKGKGSSKAGGQIIQAFTSADFVQEVLASGPTKGSAIIQSPSAAVHVDVRVVPQESFGAAAQYFTGSKEHNVEVRTRAVRNGEDERAGRWSGNDKTECGIHTEREA